MRRAAPSPRPQDDPTEGLRVELVLYPPDSPHADLVRAAAEAAGATFVPGDAAAPVSWTPRVWVVDLSRSHPAALGPRTLVIGEEHHLDCFDVVTPAEARSRLPRAVRNLVEREALRARVDQDRETIATLNEIGHALTEHDSRDALLDAVVSAARRMLRADGATLYLCAEDGIRVACAQNDTVPFHPSRTLLPLDESNVAGFVALTGQPVNIADAWNADPSTPYHVNLANDRLTGYRTRSVLSVPLRHHDGATIGVLTLVNRKAHAGLPLRSAADVLPFSASDVAVAGSIASQAALAIENHRMMHEIRALFDGFVEAAVTAIEARDPTTGGHSKRVAELTLRLADAVAASGDPVFREVRWTERDRTELHYAAMLHDFGKVGVRESVLLKAERLYPWELDAIKARFRLASHQVMLEATATQLDAAGATASLRALWADLATVRRLNRPGPPPSDADRAELARIARTWTLTDRVEPAVTPHECARLTLSRGSLDADERREIEAHVSYTWQFLRAIPWTRDLSRVPELAYAHHERLDGTGYPRGLSGDEIPLGARLMAIADIFDALTAGDRPYRRGASPDRAVAILREEAGAGKLVPEAVEVFVRQRLWLGVVGGR